MELIASVGEYREIYDLHLHRKKLIIGEVISTRNW
jgi:hypothetical protein